MYPINAFNLMPMGYQYFGQKPTASIYQPQYGEFNLKVPNFYQQTPSRRQSLPPSNRQYPPSIPTQLNKYCNKSQTKNKRRHKRRSFSLNNTINQDSYFDNEKTNPSQSSTSESHSKQQETNHNNIEQQPQYFEEKQKSKLHSRHKTYYHNPSHEQPSSYGQLPSHIKVHQEPLYNRYNQAYEESIRRGDAYRKYIKRLTRLSPEAKQQLLPHANDQEIQITKQSDHIRPVACQSRSNINEIHGPIKQEIQRLDTYIHSLEDELHELKHRLNTVTLNNNENNRIYQQSKCCKTRSPRQTSIDIELNDRNSKTIRELSLNKYQYETYNNINLQQPNKTHHQYSNHQRSHPNTYQYFKTEVTYLPSSKNPHKKPIITTYNNNHEQVRSHSPVKQQYLNKKRLVSPQVQPLPPTDYNQYYEYNNQNYNQSNNNELFDKYNYSFEKILDAFEHLYIDNTNNKSSIITPLKVKYIPEYNNNRNLNFLM